MKKLISMFKEMFCKKETESIYPLVHGPWTKETKDGFVVRCEKCGKEDLTINEEMEIEGDEINWLCSECGNKREMFTIIKRDNGVGTWEMDTPGGKVVKGMIMLDKAMK
jgi:RNase P subunit RPR2